MDAGYVVFIDEGPDLRSSFFFHPAGDLLIALGGIFALLQDPGGVLFQDLPQSLRNFFQILPGLLEFMGIQVYILHPHRGGKNIQVAIVNFPPVGTDNGGSGLIAQCKIRIVLISADHQLIQPPDHGNERNASQQSHHRQNPLMMATVQADTLMFLLFSAPSHRFSPSSGHQAINGQQGNPSPPIAAHILIVWEGLAFMRTSR